MKNERFEKQMTVVEHQGIFRRQLSLFQAVALIVSGTIGAGMLSLPYAIAKVGIGLGVTYIIAIGFLMMGLNILIGDVAMRTKQSFQLAGLARTYLGPAGQFLMTALMYSMLSGVLVVYIIGEGDALSALFGGSPLRWSLLFFTVASLCIVLGMRTVKTVEMVLSMAVLLVILLLTSISVPSVDLQHFQYIDVANIFFPYGIILFAFHSTTTIPEAYSLLRNKEHMFHRAIVIAGLIVMTVYVLFTTIVVGVTGPGTTEIATIGLGSAVGPLVGTLGNIFAVLAMGTSFLIVGLAFRDSLQWDFRLPSPLATLLVCGIPCMIFLLGIRGFASAISIIGGVLMSTELLLIIWIYLRARKTGIEIPGYPIPHVWALVVVLLLAFSAGVVYSVINLF
ncbi:MAG TPA: aromatic amino acid transport family protein [Candidatus Kapabacteria bacterium]|nr:aromatic amino acid transport family protein [Candidatus Kapabacteria bacterium]